MARILQHHSRSGRAGGSLGQPPRPAGQRGPRSSLSAAPARITLPPSPCRSFTPCNCYREPWKMGLGPVRRLAAVDWPSVIRGEAGISVCSFVGDTATPEGTEDCVPHSWTDRLPGITSTGLLSPKLPESVSLPRRSPHGVRVPRDAGGIEGADHSCSEKGAVGEVDKWLQGRGLQPALCGERNGTDSKHGHVYC